MIDFKIERALGSATCQQVKVRTHRSVCDHTAQLNRESKQVAY